MNILFVHEVDWLNKVVYELHFLAEDLSFRGHKVYAIDYEDKWKRNGLFDFGSLETREFKDVSRAFKGSSVTLRRPGFIKIPGLSRISAAVTTQLLISRTIREKKIDAIILFSVPTSGLQTVSLARKYKIPVIFRSIDVLHMMVSNRALRSITKQMEKQVYSSVDLIIPNTPQYVKYVKTMGVPESKIKLLLSPMDTDLFKPGVDTSEVRQKWGLKENEPVIVFIGTLFDFSGLDEFISHFQEVLKEIPAAKLLIVGDGVQRPKLERLIAELTLEKQVTITGFQPYRTMPEYINAATVCINTFIVSEVTINTFPSKIMQYVACGKATVATGLLGIKALLQGESDGIIYADSPAEMVPEVIALLKSPDRRKALGEAGAKAVKGKYSNDKIAEELENILKQEIQKKNMN